MIYKDVDIYFFSGTGNTLLVVKELKDFLDQIRIRVDLKRLEQEDPAGLDFEKMIGFAFPVAVQSTYPFIWDFFDSLPETEKGTEVFMIDTLAEFSGAMLGPLKSLLRKKGYVPVAACEIIMPSNYNRKKTDEEKKAALIARGKKKTRRFAHDLVFGLGSWKSVPLLPHLARKILPQQKIWYSLRKANALVLDREKCLKCGLCEKLCPVGNIRMNDYPDFDDKCQICLRCFSFCPVEAISFRNKSYIPYRSVEAGDILKI